MVLLNCVHRIFATVSKSSELHKYEKSWADSHSHLLGFEGMVFVSTEVEGLGVFLVFEEGTKTVIRHNSRDTVILSFRFPFSDFRIP